MAIILGFIISKKAHGRRMKVAFYLLILQFVLEMILDIDIWIRSNDHEYLTYFEIFDHRYRHGYGGSEKVILYETIMLYLIVAGNYVLYFVICQMGMIDIIKFQQLNTNRNFTSIIMFTTLGSFIIMQTVLFDRIYIYIHEHRDF